MEYGLSLVINDDSIVIPSDTNILSFKKMDEIDDGSEARMSELMDTLIWLVVGVVCVQL